MHVRARWVLPQISSFLCNEPVTKQCNNSNTDKKMSRWQDENIRWFAYVALRCPLFANKRQLDKCYQAAWLLNTPLIWVSVWQLDCMSVRVLLCWLLVCECTGLANTAICRKLSCVNRSPSLGNSHYHWSFILGIPSLTSLRSSSRWITINILQYLLIFCLSGLLWIIWPLWCFVISQLRPSIMCLLFTATKSSWLMK